MALSEAERVFLASRQQEAVKLRTTIAQAESEIKPIERQIGEIQPQIADLVFAQQALAAKKKEMIAKRDLFRVKNEYADVCRDITKLLKKDRGA
ncbi:MAG: hypothetical protein AAF745_00215 [Planctomycetota bacterium]